MCRNFALDGHWYLSSINLMQTPTHTLLEFQVFFVFKNLTSVTVFNFKSPDFRHLLSNWPTLPISDTYQVLLNVRFSIASGSVAIASFIINQGEDWGGDLVCTKVFFVWLKCRTPEVFPKMQDVYKVESLLLQELFFITGSLEGSLFYWWKSLSSLKSSMINPETLTNHHLPITWMCLTKHFYSAWKGAELRFRLHFFYFFLVNCYISMWYHLCSLISWVIISLLYMFNMWFGNSRTLASFSYSVTSDYMYILK